MKLSDDGKTKQSEPDPLATTSSLPIERKIERARRIAAKCKMIENRLSFFRLLSVVLTLMALFQWGSLLSPILRVASGIGFLAFFVLTQKILNQSIKKSEFWAHIVTSFLLTKARKERAWPFLKTHVQPWHSHIVQDAFEPGHRYANDLDLSTQLALLLDTCTTQGGSRFLMQELKVRGTTPISDTQRQTRLKNIDLLQKNSSTLTRIEVLRFHKTLLKLHEKLQNYVAGAQEESSQPSYLRASFVFALLCIATWCYFIINILLPFVRHQDTNQFFQQALVYLLSPLILAGVLKPLLGKLHNHLWHIQELTFFTTNFLVKLRSNINFMSNISQTSVLHSTHQKTLKRFQYLVDSLELRQNPVLWIFLQMLLPYDALMTLFVLKMEKNLQKSLPRWRTEIHEWDFLLALARLAAEDSGFVETQIKDDLETPIGSAESTESEAKAHSHKLDGFEARDIAHPALSRDVRVANTLQLLSPSQLVLLTGSNMAGKSTYLRAIGTNLLLVNMGSKAPCTYLSTRNVSLLCAIRVEDSLSEGTSYFYAEVKKLSEIIVTIVNTGALKTIPFFLIDEIFKGTNNKERLIGSWSVLKALVSQRCLGLITTHDLALPKMAETHDALLNMHFREFINPDGKLCFTYLLQPGPCPTTNALTIMANAGIVIVDPPHEFL